MKPHKNILFALGLGGYCLLNPLDANALVTHSLNYTTNSGSSGTLSGSITIDESSAQFGSFLNNSGSLPSWVTSLTITYDDGGGGDPEATFDESDFAAINFAKKSGVTVDFFSDLKPQFDDISFIRDVVGKPSAGSSAFVMGYLENEYTLASTPGPVPFLGFLSFLAFSRKIKDRIKFLKQK